GQGSEPQFVFCQCDPDAASSAEQIHGGDADGVAGPVLIGIRKIGDLNDPLPPRQAPDAGIWCALQRFSPNSLHESLGLTASCDRVELPAVIGVHAAVKGI